ncbi:glycerophosphodiester phosphodiesterase [Bdellovibrio reynosensis]|uniref:Glycerophosphodiester phosphodiesterase n=1 Tax=Bdellovibrio reynosensis TaxID=2835041 RepID=A0ABY4CE60_9BACT|nr:glycerophosphodiester phosphodiesterase family protein [Bdellovibrio reynosensis]UOF01828.1 glycerophosphodiester phosphodiesterase [Bdellovibrio reynosensis]
MLTAIVLLILFLIYRHFTWKPLPWPPGAMVPPSYQGHRGYWKSGLQENTLASFEAAAKRGLHMVEMDVRLSKDKIPVVFHDGDLKRLGNVERIVHECTAEELRVLAQVPSLEEVLSSQIVPKFLNVELKTGAIFDGELEKKVATLIEKYDFTRRVLFSSFNPLSLWRLGGHLPQVPRALLATQEPEAANKIYLRQLWFAPYVRIHALHLDYRYVSVHDLHKWKKRGVPVALWTVNEKETAELYLQEGALSIITDTLGEVADS